MAFGEDAVDFLGQAGSGALAGSALGPFGAIAGGLVGGISSLLGPKKKKRTFNDPYAGQRQKMINDLSNSQIGQQQGQLVARQSGNMANKQMEDAQNNPAYQGNASVLSALNESVQGSANDATSSAFLRGSELDMANKARAGQLMGDASQMSLAQDQYNDQLDSRKSLGESLFTNVLSTGAGYGLSSLLGGAGQGDRPKQPTMAGQAPPQNEPQGLFPDGYSPSMLSGASTSTFGGAVAPTSAAGLGGGYNGGLRSGYDDGYPPATEEEMRSLLSPYQYNSFGRPNGLSSFRQ